MTARNPAPDLPGGDGAVRDGAVRDGAVRDGAVRAISALSEVVGDYEALLCDVWGVVHDGRRVFPGAAAALRAARSRGVVVVLLTNVPRPGTTMPGALARVGLPSDTWDAIVTSGDAIRAELARRAPGPVLRIGRDTDRDLWDGLGLAFAGLDEARFLAIAGLRPPPDAPGDYLPVLRAALARDLELVCANPDVQVQVGDRLGWCAGAVAELYEGMGGRVVQAGKPHPAIYSRAFRAAEAAAGRAVPRERILAVGDGIATDLRGAQREGLDSLFVATGVHGTSLMRGDGDLDTDRVGAALGAAGVVATYAMARLA